MKNYIFIFSFTLLLCIFFDLNSATSIHASSVGTDFEHTADSQSISVSPYPLTLTPQTPTPFPTLASSPAPISTSFVSAYSVPSTSLGTLSLSLTGTVPTGGRWERSSLVSGSTPLTWTSHVGSSTLPTGTYRIRLRPVTGYTHTPALEEQITLSSAQTVTRTGFYIRQSGTLTLSLTRIVPTGGRWERSSIVSGSTPLTWTTHVGSSTLPTGTYRIRLRPVTGYTHTPALEEQITLSSAQTVTRTGFYIRRKGSIIISGLN